ncbi:MAG: hypothetical protein ACI8QC_004523 [Planctomycetota bacterium]|jgi:hypothetical protein
MLLMASPDSSYPQVSLLPLWAALAGRLSVAAGAGTALTSLFFDVPVSRACLRGGLAWLLVRWIAKGVGWLLEHTTSEPEDTPEDQPDENDTAKAAKAA